MSEQELLYVQEERKKIDAIDSIEELLYATLDASVPDDWDGAFTSRGCAIRDLYRSEFRARIVALEAKLAATEARAEAWKEDAENMSEFASHIPGCMVGLNKHKCTCDFNSAWDAHAALLAKEAVCNTSNACYFGQDGKCLLDHCHTEQEVREE